MKKKKKEEQEVVKESKKETIEVVLSADEIRDMMDAVNAAEDDGADCIGVFLYLEQNEKSFRPTVKRITLVGTCTTEYSVSIK